MGGVKIWLMVMEVVWVMRRCGGVVFGVKGRYWILINLNIWVVYGNGGRSYKFRWDFGFVDGVFVVFYLYK